MVHYEVIEATLADLMVNQCQMKPTLNETEITINTLSVNIALQK